MTDDVIKYYDSLIDEGNDPVLDPPELREYMDKWDGDKFLSLLNLRKCMYVLEIGCGTGRLGVRVAPLCRRYTGIDISPKTAEAARRHITGENSNIITGDFLTYDFRTSYDIVYCSLAFMHIEDKNAAIRKAASLIAPGGRLVLSIDKSQANVINYGTRRLTVYPDTPEEIARLIKAAGFSKVELHETELAYILVGRKLMRFARTMTKEQRARGCRCRMDVLLLEFIVSRDTPISRADVLDNLPLTPDQASKRLSYLVKRGELIRIGKGANTKYRTNMN